jgi:hypothetical protein
MIWLLRPDQSKPTEFRARHGGRYGDFAGFAISKCRRRPKKSGARSAVPSELEGRTATDLFLQYHPLLPRSSCRGRLPFFGTNLAESPLMTIDVVAVQPLIALIAGILILLVPRILNYVVAIYLIFIGLIGLWPHIFLHIAHCSPAEPLLRRALEQNPIRESPLARCYSRQPQGGRWSSHNATSGFHPSSHHRY